MFMDHNLLVACVFGAGLIMWRKGRELDHGFPAVLTGMLLMAGAIIYGVVSGIGHPICSHLSGSC
jgi:hypothetical protein